MAEKKSSIIIGNARFTVIAPECVRLEYSENRRFIDIPSMFAINRNGVPSVANWIYLD